MNERLRNGGTDSEMQSKPKISAGSRQIMEEKRMIANASGSNHFNRPVHERLHQKAVEK